MAKYSEEHVSYIKSNFSYDESTGNVTRLSTGKVFNSRNLKHDWQYQTITILGESYMKTYVIWVLVYGRFPKSELQIDHINRDRHDERLVNLREVTRKENMANRVFKKKPLPEKEVVINRDLTPNELRMIELNFEREIEMSLS